MENNPNQNSDQSYKSTDSEDLMNTNSNFGKSLKTQFNLFNLESDSGDLKCALIDTDLALDHAEEFKPSDELWLEDFRRKIDCFAMISMVLILIPLNVSSSEISAFSKFLKIVLSKDFCTKLNIVFGLIKESSTNEKKKFNERVQSIYDRINQNLPEIEILDDKRLKKPFIFKVEGGKIPNLKLSKLEKFKQIIQASSSFESESIFPILKKFIIRLHKKTPKKRKKKHLNTKEEPRKQFQETQKILAKSRQNLFLVLEKRKQEKSNLDTKEKLFLMGLASNHKQIVSKINQNHKSIEINLKS